MVYAEDKAREKKQHIITINALDLLVVTGLLSSNSERECLNWEENGLLEEDVVANVSAQRGNALLDQIGFAKKADLSKYGLRSSVEFFERDEITKYLVYVDFSAYRSMFQMKKASRMAEQMKGEDPNKTAIKRLVAEGFDIKDDNDELWRWHYRIFDKSQSMAKEYTVAFIAEKLVRGGEEVPVFVEDETAPRGLESRLCLGIDFVGTQSREVSWSKYFAYRGLYMTTGHRIDVLKGRLDESTVLVLMAPRGKVADGDHLRVLKAVEAGGRVEYETFPNDSWEGDVPDLDAVLRPQLFDGEGLISPEFSKLINRSLREQSKRGKEDAKSFQIRMPFAKGMVHAVDFRRFLAEEFGIKQGCIRDAFGVERRIEDVQMVITTDMLKCHSWLKLGMDDPNGDPMRYYFEKFKAYNHALYVSETGGDRAANGRTEVNWQFLSTLDLTPDEFKSLARSAMDSLARLRALNDVEAARGFLLGYPDDEEPEENYSFESDDDDGEEEDAFESDELALDAWDEGDGSEGYDAVRDGFGQDDFPGWEGSSFGGGSPAWRYALEMSPRFMRDPYIKKLLESKVSSALVKCSCGCFTVKGYLLYLSHDLMRLLVTLGNDCIAAGKGAVELLDEQRVSWDGDSAFMAANEFYAPAIGRQDAASSGYCGILRNPHLSRSEQAALRPCGKDAAKLYDKYFDHLTGVVMVPCDSVVPMVLGGADFDGDIVRMFGEDAIVDAILKGAYVREGGSYSRRYPIADLSGVMRKASPGEERDGALSEIGEHISFGQLESTFSGRIGLISNSAMRKGREAYGTIAVGEAPEEDESVERAEGGCDPCAKYSIATGMEIDAAKTGERPEIDDIVITPKRRGDGVERLGFLNYKKKGEPELRWRLSKLFTTDIDVSRGDDDKGEDGEKRKEKAARIAVHRKVRYSDSFKDIFKTADFGRPDDGDTDLSGKYVSNIDRLPWIFFSALDEWKSIPKKAKNAAAKAPLFTFEANWENPLDQQVGDDLESVKAALQAYRRAAKEKRESDKLLKQARQQNSYRKLCRIVFSAPQLAPWGRRSIDVTLRVMQGKVRRGYAGFSIGDDEDWLGGVIQEVSGEKYDNWAFWTADERRRFVEEYLPSSFWEESSELKSRFDRIFIEADYKQGYMAMYYLLKSVEDMLRLKKDMPVGDVEGNEPFDSELYNELVSVSNRANRGGWTQKAWRSVAAKRVRDRLLDVLGDRAGDLAHYLVYLRDDLEYFAKPSNMAEMELFWSLLREEDLEGCIAVDRDQNAS